ncbi:MAG: PRC-barrel domain-containing protein [Chloroflexi bacterium]|nr:PRC-barrel domain-containing protein [Chloroflexota bacterium]MCI0577022.1 PRC-barrel domain-containing protein [Chloroflexota bacterium]MCI0648822.1 PRC-barrel domain-containing protein [Chloroflexota bacterium]MCI0726324.1 PRC-barrel domain-containing protein [Chloroflexota bacterium]
MNRLDYHFGAQVHCTDGKCGKLVKLSVDPESWQVRDLVVEEGFLLKHARVFPASLVKATTADDITLTINSEELATYPEYKEFAVAVAPGGRVRQPAKPAAVPSADVVTPNLQPGRRPLPSNYPLVHEEIHEGVASGLIMIERGTPLKNHNGAVGKLDHVVVDADTGRITHLISHHGLVSGDELAIPASLIDRISETGIHLRATKEELKAL